MAERQREAGNALFRSSQFSEAYRCYEVPNPRSPIPDPRSPIPEGVAVLPETRNPKPALQLGLESDKRNMHLHANAAMASLKLGCFVQAIEHCDKVWDLGNVG